MKISRDEAQDETKTQIMEILDIIEKGFYSLQKRLEECEGAGSDKERMMVLREAQMFLEGVREETDQIMVSCEHNLALAKNFERFLQSLE